MRRFLTIRTVVPALLVFASIVYMVPRSVDFPVYYYGARGVFDGTQPAYGETSGIGWPMMYRYPPPFLLIVGPLTLLPFTVAAGLWIAMKYGAFMLLWPALKRHIAPERWTGLAYACVTMILGPYLFQEFRYGNAQFFVVALTCAALVLHQRKPRVGAAALALAIAVKVWPLFFLPILFVRREASFVVWTIAFLLAVLLIPSIYFGVGGNLELIGQWYEEESAIQNGTEEIWFPSQSLRGMLMRYTTAIDYTSVPDGNYRQVNFTSLDPVWVRNIWRVLAGMLYAGMLSLAYRSGPEWERVGWALAFCALCLLEPFTQKYALVALAWPAMVGASLFVGRGRGPEWAKVLTGAAAVIVVIQPLLPGSDVQRLVQVIGFDFVVATLLAVVMVGVLLRPNALSVGPPASPR